MAAFHLPASGLRLPPSTIHACAYVLGFAWQYPETRQLLQWICNKADRLDDAGKPMDKTLPPSVFSEAQGEPEMRRESAFEEARGMIGPAAWSQDGKVRELYCVLGGL